MPFVLTMPKLSPTMEEGTLVKWHKKEGDYIASGDLLFEVATDKATVEHSALDEGWVRRILVQEGDEAAVNDPLAILSAEKDESIENFVLPGKKIEQKQESSQINTSEKSEEVFDSSSSVPKNKMVDQPSFIPEVPLENETFNFPQNSVKRILASPLARKIADQQGLDLSTVKGSGPNGRIMKCDLDKAQPNVAVNFGRHQLPKFAPGSYEESALSPMRKVIGQRLQAAKTFIPHFYVSIDIDAEALVAVREQLIRQQVKVSVNDLVVRACAVTLRMHPEINCGFNSQNQTIIEFKTVDIAIAVSLPTGLITPIVRHADFKNLGELSVEIKSLALRAKEGKLEPHEYKGGSFTISNLGMFGVTDFKAIINPPQAAILAVGGIQNVPVIKNGAILPGKIMKLTLSVDHRVIDGAAAAKFLQSLKEKLESPAILLL